MNELPTLYQEFADYLADSRSFEGLRAGVIHGLPDAWSATIALSIQLGIMLQRRAPDLADRLQERGLLGEEDTMFRQAIAELREGFFDQRPPR